jgi:hypothetical protein
VSGGEKVPAQPQVPGAGRSAHMTNCRRDGRRWSGRDPVFAMTPQRATSRSGAPPCPLSAAANRATLGSPRAEHGMSRSSSQRLRPVPIRRP